MNTVATKAGYAIVAALIGVGLFTGVIARAVTTVVCGSVTMPGDFVTGLRLVMFGTTSVASVPTGCTVPLTGIRVASLLVFLAIAGVAVWAGMLWWRWRQSEAYFIADLKGRTGFAKRSEIRKYASAKAMLARADTIRPDLPKPAVTDVAWTFGKSLGQDVHVSAEDSIILEGPPRQGKGYRILIPAIIDWSGPLITTSTRSDNLTTTMRARQAKGTVSVFDPQGLSGIDGALTIDPTSGCEQPQIAVERANAIIGGTALGKSASNQEWASASSGIMSLLLHAAAVSRSSVDELYSWGTSPVAAREAADILDSDGTAGWGAALRAAIDNDPKLRSSMWMGVSEAVKPLAIPSVRESMKPGRGRQFNAAEFLSGQNTLYLIGTGAGAGASGGFLGAVLDDVVARGREQAMISTGGRLEIPLGLVLDEIANMFSWAELPTVMADGGGIGISTIVVLQAMSQAKSKWSDAEAASIWSAATAKALLGGAGDIPHLRDVEAMLGTRKVRRSSTTYSETGDSSNVQTERVPLVSVDELRRMPERIGMLLYKNRRGILLDLDGWTARGDADQISAGRKHTHAEQVAAFRRNAGAAR